MNSTGKEDEVKKGEVCSPLALFPLAIIRVAPHSDRTPGTG